MTPDLKNLTPEQRQTFMVEHGHCRKDGFVAYVLSLFFLQYAYVDRPGITLIAWVVTIVTFGFGGLVWFLFDLFRIPGIVHRYNDQQAFAVLRDMRDA